MSVPPPESDSVSSGGRVEPYKTGSVVASESESEAKVTVLALVALALVVLTDRNLLLVCGRQKLLTSTTSGSSCCLEVAGGGDRGKSNIEFLYTLTRLTFSLSELEVPLPIVFTCQVIIGDVECVVSDLVDG